MSVVTIDRFGTDPAGDSPTTWENQGDEVTVSGDNWMPGIEQGKALRQQILGLATDPSKFRNVTVDDDPSQDGFYQVLESTVTSEDLLTSDGHLSWTATLRRAPSGFAYPVVQCRTLGYHRAGFPSGMFFQPWHAVPSSWQGYDWGDTAPVTPYTRTLFGGDTMVVYIDDAFDDAFVRAGAAPADYQTGAVKLTCNGYPVIGRQIPNAVTDWTLENDLLRVSNSSGAGNHFTIATVDKTGAAWQTATGIKIGFGYAAFTALPGGVTPRSITAKRVDDEETVICLAFQSYPNQSGSLQMFLSLRRGSRYVVCALRSTDEQEWGVVFETAFTGAYMDPLTLSWVTGLRETSGSQRRVIVSGTANVAVADAIDGAVLNGTPGTALDVALGYDVDPGAVVKPDRGIDLQDQYFEAVSELQRVRAQ